MNFNIFICLLKKEIKEQFKSSRIIVFVAVFMFFGFLSPVGAKFTPQIIESISESQNISISIPEPTWYDAIAQYLKNLTQMGAFVLILIYMGLISREKESGTVLFLMVKPVTRSSFIIAKFASVLFAAIISMILSFIAASLYTSIFFEGFDIQAFAILNLFMLLYVFAVLFLTLMFSTIFNSQILSGIMSFALFLLISLFGQLDSIAQYLPSAMITESNKIVMGEPIAAIPFVSIAVFLGICLVISLRVFNKWEP